MQKNKPWQPTASQDTLVARAQMLQTLRAFFSTRNVMEIEAPLLAPHTVTDPYLDALSVHTTIDGSSETHYLQTSPEYAMKRMLAAGSGDIYSLSKAFRAEEQGRQHLMEFTMLEWYRVGFDDHALMHEVSELLVAILDCKPAHLISYHDALLEHTGLGITDALADYQAYIHSIADVSETLISTRKDCMIWMMSEVVEPALATLDRPSIVYDFPPEQAALARIKTTSLSSTSHLSPPPRDIQGTSYLSPPPACGGRAREGGNSPIAARFEAYFKGLELANGYWELNDQNEQQQRFEKDLALRRTLGKICPTPDPYFLEAVGELPDCAGVALGVDRLLMLKLGIDNIRDVVSFT